MPQIIPNHLGLILDGNRRWAKNNNMPTLQGHKQGFDNLKDISQAAIDRGISFVSAYIFSTENWNRTKQEVKYLMDLAYKMLVRDVAELNRKNIKVVWLGSKNRLSKKILKAIYDAEEKTKNNTKGTLALCFNYGGITEIVDATKNIIAAGYKPESVTEELLENALYQPTVPKVDMIIRTSGEQRTSGFMLYRAAYAEVFFIKKYWPDFTVKDLDLALVDFSKRKRRFGV